MEEVPPELGALLARTAQGDRAAFRVIYDRSSAKLFGVVLRIVRSRDVAEEVVQEAYLRIWQKASRYDPTFGQPMTWMISIARYAAIDRVRQRGDARPDAGGDSVEEIAASDDPERDVTLQRDLLRCLGQLGVQQREAVLLAYCSGHSREDLARHFTAPVPTVKTWLRRSLLALRLCLEAP